MAPSTLRSRPAIALLLAALAIVVTLALGRTFPGPAYDLTGTSWSLRDPRPPVGSDAPTLFFEEASIGGHIACNDYQADYALRGRRLELVRGMLQTQVFCFGDGNAFEREFSRVFYPQAWIEMDGQSPRRTLTLRGGGRRLVFEELE